MSNPHNKDIWESKFATSINLTGDCRFKTPHRKDKKLVRKIKRNIIKKETREEIKEYE